MVAPNQSMRVGSGGITYTVDGDVSKLKASLVDAANWAKQQKVQPQIDFEQTTIVRGVESIRRRIQREVFKAQVAVELDRLGLAEAAKQIGALKERVAEPVRARRFTGFEADVRDTMAAQIRAERAERRHAAIQHEVLRRTAKEGYDDTGLEYGPQNRPSRLSRIFETAQMLRMGLQGAGANMAFEGVAAASQIGRGGALALSGDPMLRMQGGAMMMQGAGEIPVVGNLIRAFDRLAGITDNLNAAMKARGDIEGRTVRMASLGGDPLATAQAQGNLAMLGIRRDMMQTQAAMGLANLVGGAPVLGPLIQGLAQKVGGDALAMQAQNMQGQAGENALAVDIARRQRNAMVRGAGTRGLVAMLTGGQQPMTADRAALQAELASGLETAPAFMRFDPMSGLRAAMGGMGNLPDLSLVGVANREVMAAQNRAQRREFEVGLADSNAHIGAAEMRVRNRGQTFADETTLTQLRGLDRMVELSPNEFGLRGQARMEAVAEGRALRASLIPRGGGIAGASNLSTDLIGDPANLIPELRARNNARRMVDDFLGKYTGGDPSVRESRSMPDNGTPDWADRMIRLLEMAVDALGQPFLN